MKSIRLLPLLIIFLSALLYACSTAETPAPPPPTATETTLPPTAEATAASTATAEPTAVPTSTPSPLPPSPTPTQETFPFTWEGTWNVWIGHPNVSIVNTADFEVSGEAATAEWYEGSRLVSLAGDLSPDGSTITGLFLSSDVDVLEIRLVLDPSGAFFTGTADSEAGNGQFCGTRTSQTRPSPCRAPSP